MATSSESEAPSDTMSSEDIYSSLVVWLESCLALNDDMPIIVKLSSTDVSELADGIAMADCLQQLAPSFFNRSWRSRIIPEASASWRLQLSNLKKILKSIEQYYSDSLRLSLDSFPRPDVQLIAEKESQEHMNRLLQLILGIAVHCEHKEKYIQAIMTMEKSVQHTVMALIQELMSLESPSAVQIEVYRELDEQYQHTLNELKSLRSENEEMKQKLHDTIKKYSEKEDEVTELSIEVQELREKTSREDEFGTPGGVKLQRVSRKLQNIKSEKEKMEEECDELQDRILELETRLSEVEGKNEELLAENAELPALRDTVEELKYLEGKVKNYESVISQYKKKVEDMQEMRKQLKSLEDKNVLYMQQNLDLEEELRRLSSYRSSMDSQKKKIAMLENEIAKEKLKSLEMAQEMEEKGNLIETQSMEITDLRTQLDKQSLPSTPLQPQASLFSEMGRGVASSEGTDFGGTLLEAYTPELKEKMMRLEKENQILLRRLDTDDDGTTPTFVAQEGDETAVLQLAEKSAMMETLERNLKKKTEELSRYQSSINHFAEEMKAKDVELDKYKKYLNKAKKIIEGFGDRRPDAAMESAEIQQLKSMLQEREKEIERLEKSMEQDRGIREKEERLILSAWYNLGMKYHQQQAKERLHPQASFLQQQRQASLKRAPPTTQ